jgi:hypothetical protein
MSITEGNFQIFYQIFNHQLWGGYNSRLCESAKIRTGDLK